MWVRQKKQVREKRKFSLWLINYEPRKSGGVGPPLFLLAQYGDSRLGRFTTRQK
jgi:hypothetical protein